MANASAKDSGSDAPLPPASTRSRVDGVIKGIISDHQGVVDTQSATDIIQKELLKLYDKPKVSQLEAVLFKRITEDEARHILFLPDHDQAAHYPTLIASPPNGAPAEHPQHALQVPHLSLLYLHHLKRWDFVSAFVLSGGLHALCSLFTHDNLVVRMKAITSLVSITAHPGFDWFSPPPGRGKGRGVDSNTVETRLHRALLGLRSEPAFISGLIANSWSRGAAGGTDATAIEERGGGRGGKTFPGVCLMCLELLAMWLSWVRALHTVDGTLRLSRPLFRAIEEWGGKDDERKGNIAWSERVPLPTLPHTNKPCGSGKAEGGGAIVVAEGEKVEDEKFTPVAVLTENDSGAAAVAEGDGSSTGGRTPAGDLEAETAAMIQVERKERAEVLELSKKLVADFARFPPAEQEWEGVEEDSGDRSGGDLPRGGGAVAPPPTEEGGWSTVTVRGCCDDEARGSGDSGREEISKEGGETRSSPPEAAEVVPEPPPMSALTRKALALKTEGNEAFGEGDMHAAMKAYTKALSVLNGAAEDSQPFEGAPPKNQTTTTTTTMTTTKELEASRAEATALSGVLHRNRAAAALRLFNSKAAVAAARKERATEANQKDEAAPRGGGVDDDIGSAAGCSQRQPSTPSTPPDRRRTVPPGRERRTEEKTDDERRSLELSLALLEECESDCLRAIEVDARDRKARLRLDKCRELRRRCYRGGLASASAGREGCSTAHSRQDERLQGRKADLVAKILARAEKSHEIIGGSGGSKKTTTPSVTATVPEDSSFSTASDGGSSDGTTANETLLAGAGRHDGSVDSGGCGGDDCGDREGLPAAATDKCGAAPVLARQQEGERHAPREGGELRGVAVARASAEPTTAAASTQQGINHHHHYEQEIPFAAGLSSDGPLRGSGSGVVEADRVVSNGNLGKKTQKKKMASKKKKSGEHSQGNSASRSSRHGKAGAVAVRSLRQRLEGVATRAAKTGTRQEGREKRTEAAREVWSVLADGGVSLQKLFGNGITAESLVGIALGLRHGCGIDGSTSNTERASQLFVELSRVKRVGLVSAMCSADDRLPLADASEHIRRHHEESLKEHLGGRLQPTGCSGGGGGSEEEALPQGCGGESRWSAFEAAVATLGVSQQQQ